MQPTVNYWFNEKNWRYFQRQVQMLCKEQYGTTHASLLTHEQYDQIKDKIEELWKQHGYPEVPGPDPTILP